MERPGNRRRVEQLVAEHYVGLYRYAYRLAGCEAEAADLAQETYCKAQMRLHQLRDPERAKAWLFSILRNAYLHRIRSASSHRAVSLDAAGDLPEAPLAPLPEVEPERLQAALDALPEPFRTPVILYYFEEFSYRDIAEHMDVPIGTVMSRLARAKEQLRKRLQPEELLETNAPSRRAAHGL